MSKRATKKVKAAKPFDNGTPEGQMELGIFGTTYLGRLEYHRLYLTRLIRLVGNAADRCNAGGRDPFDIHIVNLFEQTYETELLIDGKASQINHNRLADLVEDIKWQIKKETAKP
jgi:hypothetical protein